MTKQSNQIDRLLEKLDVLQKNQDSVSREMYQLRKEIYKMKAADSQQEQETEAEKVSDEIQANEKQPQEKNTNLEKFIGENLINKIGIAITIVGVFIGVKYSIDHDLISPLTRILLGYLAGSILLLFGIRLKKSYENYSAVLVSGSMAVFYFITYAAYTFYALFPQLAAFAILVAITVLTVAAALKYNKVVIALIGQVGAYAIPFLLSNDSGNAWVLFSYMAIINAGVLVIAIKKYWESLYYSAFVLTWMIFFSWLNSSYKPESELTLALLFLGIFFALFYFTFLAYKFIKDYPYNDFDIPLLIANTAIFFGVGYTLLHGQKEWKDSLGSFTVLNALIHFSVSLMIYFRKLKDKNLFYLITGLALVFVTIAIPVQLDGYWITMLWAGEMAVFFWIGRTQKISVYEILSYPVMVLTFFSLIHSWAEGYFHPEIEQFITSMPSVFNGYFLTTLIVSLAFGLVHLINSNEKYASSLSNSEDFLRMVALVIPSLLLFTVYFLFRNEIAFYWDQQHFSAVVKATGSWNKYYADFYTTDLLLLKTLWIINYSILFFSALSFINISQLKNRSLAMVNLILNLLAICAILTVGLYSMGKFHGTNLVPALAPNLQHSFFNAWIRYISFGFLALIFFASYRYIREDFLKRDFRMEYDLALFTTIICVASSELINWMNLAGSSESFKLGLSILWGAYSLFLISLGIWKKKKYLRIGAIALFAVTLVKLFLYDLSDLDTISKTIVFVSLGTLLLIISFIYNKFKDIITD